jgi:hypothetical protein
VVISIFCPKASTSRQRPTLDHDRRLQAVPDRAARRQCGRRVSSACWRRASIPRASMRSKFSCLRSMSRC